MRLAQLFSQHAARPAKEADVSLERLDGVLQQMVAAGAARWPELSIAPDEFVLFLARQLPPEATTADGLLSLHASELFLLRALGLGLPAALRVFETDYMPEVRRTLQRLDTPEPMIADIIQSLYAHLLERQNAAPGAPVIRQGYVGRGELKGWLCVCAVHLAGRRLKRDRREVQLEEAPAVLLPIPQASPDQALLTGELKELFETAFREAVSSLTSRERNLLRYHFLSGLSIDQIGMLYRVHRATAARWLVQARERLAKETHRHFLAAAPVHAQSLTDIVQLVRSQISTNLVNLLKSVKLDHALPGGVLSS
ncbi:MAG: sigma-70 family RNA polymerase sigma factor [Polyangia bacterium]